mmetsp:Transcript_87387/g.211986  ORF Transcript_87387/g.211986 Transcript_87387/m.211986 type:complete len:105 (-) Transcript_87387:547-861(-)
MQSVSQAIQALLPTADIAAELDEPASCLSSKHQARQGGKSCAEVFVAEVFLAEAFVAEVFVAEMFVAEAFIAEALVTEVFVALLRTTGWMSCRTGLPTSRMEMV